MRKSVVSVVIIAFLAMFFALDSYAQYLPQRMEMVRGELVNENGEYLSDSDILFAIGEDIYHETYEGASKQSKVGGRLIVGGAIGTGVGLLGYAASVAVLTFKYGDKLPGFIQSVSNKTLSLKDIPESKWFTAGVAGMAASGVLMALGSTVLSVGIPLRVIGNSRLNWIANNYNEQNAPQAFLHVGAGQYGTGLILNF